MQAPTSSKQLLYAIITEIIIDNSNGQVTSTEVQEGVHLIKLGPYKEDREGTNNRVYLPAKIRESRVIVAFPL